VAKAALGAGYPELLEAAKIQPTRAGAESDLITQSLAIQPSRYLAQKNAALGLPTYSYYFDEVAGSDRGQAKGADHGGELSFLFGTRIDKEVWDDQDRRVSELMGDYWVRFAKTGDPNGKAAPNWAPVTRNASPYMHFDAKPHTAQPAPLEDKLEAAVVAVAEKAWDAAK
jgi:para-nitrobenzyl esterase